MSVTWVLNGSSQYEISSKEHLIQLMNTGSIYTDTGTPPTSYLSSSYVQTVSIDLQADSNIEPITTFTGQYDGQGYSISNWTYTTPGTNHGFFGATNGAIIQNMVLDGVWILLDVDNGGFLAANNTNSQFYNITTNFSPGTRATSTGNSLGGLFAYTSGGTGQNLTLGGTIDEFSGTRSTGGICSFNNGATFSHVRNMATFTTGMTNTETFIGGIFGHCSGTTSHLLNTMNGNIAGFANTGGIFGRLNSGADDAVCAMLGNITSSNGIAAGISPTTTSSGVFTRCLNYMRGDVTNCLFGTVSAATISQCVVAMDGTATNAAFQSGTATSEILLDTSFGLTVSNTNNTQATMDTSSFAGIDTNGLPFISFAFTDNASNTIDWPFVFFGALPASFDIVPGVLTASVVIPIEDGIMYRLSRQGVVSGDPEIITHSGVTTETRKITNLKPSTDYTVRLYSNDGSGSGYQEIRSESITTLSNTAGNYDKDIFLNDGGKFDFTGLDETALDNLSSVMNELFNTGDTFSIDAGNQTDLNVSFVKRGETSTITESGSSALLLPFDDNSGSSQTVSLTLNDSGGTTIAVTYDELAKTIATETSTYSIGDSFVLDGKKVSVIEY